MNRVLGPPICPYCNRLMSNRERDEQRCCNDCAEPLDLDDRDDRDRP